VIFTYGEGDVKMTKKEKMIKACEKIVDNGGSCSDIDCDDCPGHRGNYPSRRGCRINGWASASNERATDEATVKAAANYLKENKVNIERKFTENPKTTSFLKQIIKDGACDSGIMDVSIIMHKPFTDMIKYLRENSSYDKWLNDKGYEFTWEVEEVKAGPWQVWENVDGCMSMLINNNKSLAIKPKSLQPGDFGIFNDHTEFENRVDYSFKAQLDPKKVCEMIVENIDRLKKD